MELLLLTKYLTVSHSQTHVMVSYDTSQRVPPATIDKRAELGLRVIAFLPHSHLP